jgi:hypothetical protein
LLLLVFLQALPVKRTTIEAKLANLSGSALCPQQKPERFAWMYSTKSLSCLPVRWRVTAVQLEIFVKVEIASQQ